MRAYRLLTLGLLALAAINSTAVLQAQTSSDLFDPNVVQDLRIFINSRDLRTLRERYQENAFYPADILWRNVRVRNVAVRSHGVASRNGTKLGLTIDIDRYTRGQTFVGLQGLVLDNLWPDPGMIREFVAMRFFERMGQPAPRESFARLYINNVDQGLYGVVEQIDAQFLTRTIGDDRGYLFEMHRLFPWFGEYLGDDLSPYKAMFEPRTHELEADTLLWGPLRDLFREINHEDDAVWRERVEELLDLPAFLRQVAIESFLTENDGIIGGAGMTNFYVYRPSGSNRHRWLPWDRDTTFFRERDVADPADGLHYSIFERMDSNVLMRRALGYPELRSIFVQTAEDCARAAAEDDWLANEVDRVLALVTGVAHADRLKQYSNADFDSHVEFIREFARERPRIVLEETTRIRASETAAR